ncbi:hypothetical protein RDWZM_008633 [Blomia tropicalis]|uniref:Enolase-phosphatase E1 n=1 Tax=Blomia tropicalis TaxID=40697 RepID=A0A9Q0RKA0_BLOTA|nr:Enolase-phosphatase E1 [Blomia tropicalis]KAJ6217476.1 hypothetical protein RDWZM_008633 [Blomia tropicalis]
MVQVKLKKPAAVLFDFSGTCARETFVEKYLMPYYKVAFRPYLENNWSKDECKEDVKGLTAAASGDSAANIKIDSSGSKKEQVDALCKYIEYCEENKKVNKAYCMFRFHVWFDGYDKGKVQTPVYSDVAVHIQKWHCDLKIKLFILSNGWADATKKFMSRTSHGDLNILIESHFDTSLGSLTDTNTYKKVIGKVNEKPASIVFLTKSAEEGKAAKDAGLTVILVLTHGKAVEAAEEMCKEKDIPIARSFTQIEFF